MLDKNGNNLTLTPSISHLNFHIILTDMYSIYKSDMKFKNVERIFQSLPERKKKVHV